MVAIAALAVVPAGQVDTSGFAVTLNKAICTLIDIWRDEERRGMNRVHVAVLKTLGIVKPHLQLLLTVKKNMELLIESSL